MRWFWQKRPPAQPGWADIVGDYGSVLEKATMGIGGSRSEDELPYDKATIKRALVEAANQEGIPEEMLNAIGGGYISLANFRAGGGKPSRATNLPRNVEKMTNDELVQFAKQLDPKGEASMAKAILADATVLMEEWNAIKASRA